MRKDRYGRVIEDISSVDSRAAHNLTLSIDERLQALVYRELNNAVAFNKAESGTAVLVDVNTGEVLAMANSPAYNPNNLSNTPKDVMRNRAITDIFERFHREANGGDDRTAARRGEREQRSEHRAVSRQWS